MADKKISDLTALTGANVADTDLLPIVDTSATETKKITFAEFKTALDTATGFVRITGDTMTGDLSFGDGDKAIFGAGSDLQIYHTDNQNYIEDAGTGNLNFKSNGNNFNFLDGSDNVVMQIDMDSATTLYHNTSAKLATTDTGIDVTGTTTSDQYLLDAISDTIAVTAVDVFVYDTSKDSDGGAWRKRTQGTSWYNETLDTATRGSRREFPAVAVIVAEAAKVTIYDGDDPALPMWRVTNQIDGVVPQFWRAGRSATSLYALNGKLVIGLATDTAAGLAMIDFAADLLFRWSSGGTSDGTLSGVSNDASATATLSGVLPALVSTAVNDVAMTVLPNAPIDAATGLPVPTIAVATDGGVSVITDSGAVWDLTYTIVNVESGSVFFPASGGISWSSRSSSGYVYLFREFELPTADKSTAPDKIYGTSGQVSYWPPAIGSSNVINAIDGAISGTGNGLTHLAEDPVTPANGMVAYTTSSYNTGWMNGNIKGAFLSDTDATSVTGSEITTDGTFSDTANWTEGDAAWSVTGGALVGTSVPTNKYTGQSITSIPSGSLLTAVITVSSYTAGNLNFALRDVQLGANETPVSFGVNGTGTFTATMRTTQANAWLEVLSSGTTTMTIDNVSVRLAEADRSVNNKGLQVFGTVTKTAVATGADLVAYSGFSASNYLEQPYNSALDFGTGDFSVMGWFQEVSTIANDTFLDRADAGGNKRISIGFDGSGGFGMYTQDGSASSLYTTTVFTGSGTWHFGVVVRQSDGIIKIYIDGALSRTSGALTSRNVTSATGVAPFTLGNNYAHSGAFASSLALLRISATAPTAAQIAKIYNDEKYLFQAGAQATLYGASDAVTALAYDDATDLLHVGTSGGRSVFQGLRRVSNTTDAVGAAISASNGLVAED